MNYETIADMYSANESIRERLRTTVAGLSDQEAAAIPEGERWSAQMIVEHLWMVEFGVSRICSKLLEAAKADGVPGDGRVKLSSDFGEKAKTVGDVKVQAPERVEPSGKVTIAEALEKMVSSRELIDGMRRDLEQFDVTRHKFPHPYFGEITAAEWIVMLGGHEARHTRQIERILAKVRQ